MTTHAADERRRARLLRDREPDPERAQHDLEERDQGHLGRRDQPRAEGEEGQAEPHLARAEEEEQPEVGAADLARIGERRRDHEHDELREASRGRHRDLAVPARDHHDDREGERHEECDRLAADPLARRPADHDADAGESEQHRDPGAPADRLSQHDPGEDRGRDRRQRLQEEDVRDRGLVQRDDEGARSDRHRERE